MNDNDSESGHGLRLATLNLGKAWAAERVSRTGLGTKSSKDHLPLVSCRDTVIPVLGERSGYPAGGPEDVVTVTTGGSALSQRGRGRRTQK